MDFDAALASGDKRVDMDVLDPFSIEDSEGYFHHGQSQANELSIRTMRTFPNTEIDTLPLRRSPSLVDIGATSTSMASFSTGRLFFSSAF